MRAILLAAMLATTFGATARADTIGAEPLAIEAGTDTANRMTVPVMINGQGPFQFVIDTGADRTVISQELADRLALPALGKAKLHAMTGTAMVRVVKIDKVQVSTNIARNVRAAALPARNLGADGLLGIDSLKGQRVIMDFREQTARIVPAIRNGKTAPEDEGMIVVTAQTRLGQLVMVDADANGQKVWVVVDTGAQNSVGNSRLKSLLVKRNAGFPLKPIGMTDVLGKTMAAEYAVVEKMRFGSIAMSGAAIAFADAHPFKLFALHNKPSLLLGMEGLRSFDRISVDFANKKLRFLLPREE